MSNTCSSQLESKKEDTENSDKLSYDSNHSNPSSSGSRIYEADYEIMQIRLPEKGESFMTPEAVKMRTKNDTFTLKTNCDRKTFAKHSWKFVILTSVLLAVLSLPTKYVLGDNTMDQDRNFTMDSQYIEPDMYIHHYDDYIFTSRNKEKQTLDDLLKNPEYDKRILPPVDGKLSVNVSVLLLSLASPDESSLKYEVEFLLNQEWIDPRLAYHDSTQHEYLNAIHHHQDIWLPDTYFSMHGDFKHPLVPTHFALKIYKNGTITYSLRQHLIISCNGILEIFPFDDPVCTFSLESISYDLNALEYRWKNNEATIKESPSIKTLNAHLIANKTVLCDVKDIWRGDYSCLRVQLTFARDRAFYFTTVFIPGMILVTSSFVSFWLEWNSVPARAMIGVTTMLNFFTSSNSFRGKLPVVSSLTAMNVWDGACMCFIYISLLEFICVNYVGRKRPLYNTTYMSGEKSLKRGLPKVLRRIRGIFTMPLETIEQEFLAATAPDHQYFSKFRRGATPRNGSPSPRPKTRRRADGVSPSPSTIFNNNDNIPGESPRIVLTPSMFLSVSNTNLEDVECGSEPPIKPPRRKTSREQKAEVEELRRNENERASQKLDSEKLKINFEKTKKKEPPHPIRIAKTIDVIARMVFPTAYAFFLIYFFVHYNVGKTWHVD